MNPLARPQPGHEAEFRDLWKRLNIAFGHFPDPEAPPEPKKGFWARLVAGGPKKQDLAPLLARFNAISAPPWSQVGAPVIGQDAVADDWVRAQWTAGRLGTTDRTAEAAVARLSGLHVLDLLPTCDGFPALIGASGERCTLRGQALAACGAVLPAALIEQAWKPMLAEDLARWSDALMDALANAGHAATQDPGHDAIDLDTVSGQVAAIACAARWGRFWSSRGHGSEPDF